MYVPQVKINGTKFYMASPITRQLGFSDASTYLKKYVAPHNRVLLKASDFGVSGPKAWAINVDGLSSLIQNCKNTKQGYATFQNIFDENKPRTVEQCIVDDPDKIIELCKMIKRIKESNERIEVMSKSISNLLKEVDSILC